MLKITEGSHAVAEVIKNIGPKVVSAYPITPQTHIVEKLADYHAEGADFKYLLAESEFAAASIVEGAVARGVRAYTATSSQGLLLMTEVLFNIAGMRLPLVMTVANRAVSAPINIWNDQQDSITVRDAGWIMLYAEDNQEATDMHLEAYKIAEQVNLPVMVNMDGYILTHTYEPVDVPEPVQVKKFLPSYKPAKGTYLDPKNPVTLGAFATPETYMEIREDLFNQIAKAKSIIKKTHTEFKKQFKRGSGDGLVEGYKLKNAHTVLISFGSVLGTMKDVVYEMDGVGILKIRCLRPFPTQEIKKLLEGKKNIAVIEKCISLGKGGVLADEVRSVLNQDIKSFIVGLGGKDVTKENIKEIVKKTKSKKEKINRTNFIYS